MSKPVKTYVYKGPIMRFDKVIDPKWYGETTAKSKRQAINNLRWKWSQESSLVNTGGIYLDDKYLSEMVV